MDNYTHFVKSVTGGAYEDLDLFIKRLTELNNDANMSLLVGSGLGLSGETGEFNDIIKKVVLQGKPLDDETRVKLGRELGDIIWYWVNSCRALGFDPDVIISENVQKLEKRYPNRKFRVSDSENRKESDD